MNIIATVEDTKTLTDCLSSSVFRVPTKAFFNLEKSLMDITTNESIFKLLRMYSAKLIVSVAEAPQYPQPYLFFDSLIEIFSFRNPKALSIGDFALYSRGVLSGKLIDPEDPKTTEVVNILGYLNYWFKVYGNVNVVYSGLDIPAIALVTKKNKVYTGKQLYAWYYKFSKKDLTKYKNGSLFAADLQRINTLYLTCERPLKPFESYSVCRKSDGMLYIYHK